MSGRTRIAKNALTAATLLFGLGIWPSKASAYMDDVRFGDARPEETHAFVGANSIATTVGLRQPCRRIAPGGSLVFQLKCDPSLQNYLTVKFWGADTEVATLFLFDGDRRIGAYGSAWPELDLGAGEAAFPGRFYYTTYMIPHEMTQGKNSVTLKLAAIGRLSPYAADPRKREGPQEGTTRGIYRAYSHTAPFFVPGNDEAQGEEPQGRMRPPPKDASPLASLRKQTDDAITQLLRWQCYGPEWNAAVQKGDVPGVVIGAALPPTRIQRRPVEEWKNLVVARTTDGNATAMNVLAIFAMAYQSKWSHYYQDPGLLDRVVKGLDFYCVAQGANGGFYSATWVGGPQRKPAGTCLEGFGTSGLGQAFVLIQKESAEKGMLDQEIDTDDDPKTPRVSRRTAYAEMFDNQRSYLVSDRGRGHASNQDMAQIGAMWLANESLRSLAPEKVWPREKALGYVYCAVGLRECPLGGFWVTRKGLALEPWGTLGGGYSGNYGAGCVQEICRLAELSGDAQVQQRALDAVHAFANFVYPSTDADGCVCLRKEETISARITKWPGRVYYGGNDFAAAVLKDPSAIRAAQLALAHGNQRSVLDQRNAHFVGSVLDALLHMEHVGMLLSLPPTDCRLPMEDGQPDYAWADEQGGTVVVKHRGARIYMSLNWRRGFSEGKRDAKHAQVNNIARVHYTTPTIDRIATIAMESPYGFGKLYICRYGDYLVGMNLTEDTTYKLPVSRKAGAAVDLISGKSYPLATSPQVPPSSTRVLYLGNGK